MTENEIIQSLVKEFCDLILLDDDALEFGENAENFIDKWVKLWKIDCLNNKTIRDNSNDVLQSKFHNYEMLCQKSAPYSFLSSLQNFQNEFYSKLREKTDGIGNKEAITCFVSILNYVINTIKKRSDHFDAIKIYLKLKDREEADPLSERVSDLFKKVNDAEEKINTAVKNASNLASKKTTETGVTILGMFSGIVLTVVSGLFYSSSVINNINTSDFYRLISTAALVGVVCFDLLALMFHYVERIRNGGKTKISWFTIVIVLVNIVFIGIMWYYSTLVNVNFSDKISDKSQKSVFDINISLPIDDSIKAPKESHISDFSDAKNETLATDEENIDTVDTADTADTVYTAGHPQEN